MFGYVKAHKPEMRVAEYEYYRSVYCGLCRSMGKCTGQCSRLTLSYDFAFLALVRMALSGDEDKFEQRRCIAHPIKKRSMLKSNPTLEYCSRAAALLSYHKLLDDISDERGAKRLRAKLLRPSLSHMRRKALRKEGMRELDEKIELKLGKLAEYEQRKEASVDAPADLFGELLADIMEFGFDSNNARIARSIGFHIGRWIYIVDALDDLAEDIEKERYNPIALMYSGEPDERELSLISDALKLELCDAEAAFDLLDIGERYRLSEVIKNVIYLGMPMTVKRLNNKQNCRKKGQFEIDERSL